MRESFIGHLVKYRQTPNIRRTFVGNIIVDSSNAARASVNSQNALHVASVKQLFSIKNFIPVVEHAPTLTVCLSLTNFKTHQPEGPMKFLV